VLAQYYQPDMIYLISGESRVLDTQQWTPISVNSIPKAYSTRVTIVSLGAVKVFHNNSNAALAVLSYGFCKHQAYGHPGKCNNNSGRVHICITCVCVFNSNICLALCCFINDYNSTGVCIIVPNIIIFIVNHIVYS